MNFGLGHIQARKPISRGIARSGPAILSYGFRPFFLGAGLFALLAMLAWIGALSYGWETGGSYGSLNWHAHEMLFGYVSAALAGFILTAIPNWTGRLPVSGVPLLGLVSLWLAGRIAMLAPDAVGLSWSMAIDAAFLPVVAFVVGREIVAGRNWKNLKVLVGVTVLALANVSFHITVASGEAPGLSARVAVAVYVVLVALVGGRIIPSFTRNWLVKAGSSRLPASFGRFDAVALAVLAAALLGWALLPEAPAAAALALAACVLHLVRLWRWRGGSTLAEPLLLVLHVAYLFIPIGLAGIGLAAMGWIGHAPALHVLTVGVIGNMTLAVMTRASLGHTGRPLEASALTSGAYLAMILAAVLRPFAELIPQHYHLILGASGLLWIVAFGAFVAEYAPILCAKSLGRPGR